MHDPTKVLLGATHSSAKVVDNRAGVIDAGKVVRLKSDDTISIASADGNILGLSVGRSLSGTDRTAVLRKGLSAPILLTDAFTPAIGAQVAIHNTTGIAAAKDGSSTFVNAVYKTGVLTGVSEAGTSLNVALIDFPGGL